jgi:hypothetical protein
MKRKAESENTLSYKQALSTLTLSADVNTDFQRMVKYGRLDDKTARAVKIEMIRRGFNIL